MNLSNEDVNNVALLPGSERTLKHDVASITSDILPLIDILTLLLAGYLSTLLYAGTLGSVSLPIGSWAAFGPAVLVAAVLAPFILYDKQFGLLASRAQGALLVRGHGLRFVLLAGVVFAISVANQSLTALPGAWLVLWGTTSLLFTSLTRVLLAAKLRHLERGGVLSEVIAIVGSGPLADRLVKQLRRGNQNIELLGVFDDKIQGAERGSVARTGSVAELIELGKTRKIDWIVMTLPCTAEDRLRAIVQRLKALAVPIGLCPENVGLTLPFHQIDYVGEGVPVTLLADRPIRRWGAVIKGGEDFVLGAIITLMLLPVMALVALAIRLDSPGPIIFKQRRHAFNNSEFDIYKFRSMRWTPAATSTELKQTSRNDDRITWIGRFLRSSSLDELPQLFNVLKGEMSLVGPRPHAVNMRTEDRLGSEIIDVYAHRHRVKPGITGWSQVNGARGATDTMEQLKRRIELDLYYVENWSLLFDFKILLMTVREVMKKTNAY